jgi:hypothetical protein
MSAIRKRLFVVLFTPGALIALVLALVLRPSPSPPPGTLVVHYVTTNAAGTPMALLELTLHRPAWIRYDSIAVRRGDDWHGMKISTNLFKYGGWTGAVTLPNGAARKAYWIEFPTNRTWKLRLEFAEPRTGIGGAIDRVLHVRRYYRLGGWSNIFHGTRPVPHVGRISRIESEEIRLP